MGKRREMIALLGELHAIGPRCHTIASYKTAPRWDVLQIDEQIRRPVRALRGLDRSFTISAERG